MEFEPRTNDLIVECRNESYGKSEHNWIFQALDKHEGVRISKFLFVTRADIVDDSLSDDPDATILVRVADADGGYWKFRREVLGISFDLFMALPAGVWAHLRQAAIRRLSVCRA